MEDSARTKPVTRAALFTLISQFWLSRAWHTSYDGALGVLSRERHFMLECPQSDDIRTDARDSMRNLMWHQNQKALSDFVIAILDEPRT